MNIRKHKTIFLSDIHLGYKDCKAEFLLDFLDKNHAEQIYLIGDIVDLWALKRQFYWPASHNAVLSRLVELSRKGTQITYLPGNHDEDLKAYSEEKFNDIVVTKRTIHTTASGKQLLLLHGDDFDSDVCLSKFAAKLGDTLYDFLLFMNRHFNRIRRKFGYHYWSLASHIKSKVPKANEAIARYKHAALKEAKKLGLDGVVCGHIHHPEIEIKDDVMYCNDGDWIENCTALVESFTGDLAIIHWSEQSRNVVEFDAGSKQVVKAA